MHGQASGPSATWDAAMMKRMRPNKTKLGLPHPAMYGERESVQQHGHTYKLVSTLRPTLFHK
jgi:hypothetical protein